MFNFPLTKS